VRRPHRAHTTPKRLVIGGVTLGGGRMEFRILGPLEVLEGGRPLAIRRGKDQALLAYLLLHANEVVSSSRLIDVLWDERPPPTAPKALQNAVSSLRRQLGEGRLVTRDPGYVLRVEPGELDLARFEKLAREGRADEALELWRGPPLLELHEERFADDARRRLDEQRLAVLEARIDADLGAGRSSGIIPELEELVREHPLRERLYGQLMLALYRAGRQADALETFRRARRTLSEEVGLEPGPQLQDLERRVLQQDPTLTLSAGEPRAKRRRRSSWALALALIVIAAAAVSAFVLTREDRRTLAVVPNSVVEIDTKTNRIVGVVPVGRRPSAIAIVGQNMWVANSLDDTLTHIDTRSGATRILGGFEYPTSLARAARKVWVGNNSRGVLVSIDAVSGAVIDRVQIPKAAAATFLSYGAGSIWVSEEEAAVHRISITTGKTTMQMPDLNVHELAFGEGAAWAVLAGIRRLLRIDAYGRANREVDIGPLSTGVAVGFGEVWVASSGDDTVWKIDPQILDVKDVIDVGDHPEGVAVAAGAVWVANNRSGTVSRIDPRNDNTTIVRTGYNPLAIAGNANRVWVAVAGAPEQ
jgi:YVTN family beta-propeller protein